MNRFIFRSGIAIYTVGGLLVTLIVFGYLSHMSQDTVLVLLLVLCGLVAVFEKWMRA